MNTILDSLQQFWQYTGFANCTWQHLAMICIGLIFITLGIVKKWEPLLLVPIGFGIIIGNIPLFTDPVTGVGLKIGLYEEGSVLNILYHGVRNGWYPPLIFLGIGAMTDFSALISQPRLILIGAAAHVLIFRVVWNGQHPVVSVVAENYTDWKAWVIFAIAFLLGITKRAGPIAVILGAAVVGLLIY